MAGCGISPGKAQAGQSLREIVYICTNQRVSLDRRSDMKKKFEAASYTAPECVAECRWDAGILCSSPASGGNEDVVYDDWNDLLS